MEPSVFVEIDIKEMNTLDKFNQFIGLWTHYHLNRCKNGPKCSNCSLILNLRFVYDDLFVDLTLPVVMVSDTSKTIVACTMKTFFL